MSKNKILTLGIIFLLILNIYQFQQMNSLNKKLEGDLKGELNSAFSVAKEILPNELEKTINTKQITRQEFDTIWYISNDILFGIDDSLTFTKKYDIDFKVQYQNNSNKLAGEVNSFYREFLNSKFQDGIEIVPLSDRDIEYLEVLKELSQLIGALTSTEVETLNIEETIKRISKISNQYEEELKKIRSS
ncbi:hypothetical protein FZC74_00795 [Sutcliffiella horikoshii]|uniref:Uncharacterized protein n=1 Tax=Sutcliffiella horikoshii TaxID=79883 RepID=A0AA94WR19_9BACI|nr:hypothetical protein [Sutcliffiella horikoshii]TYS60851.1 hypothetical protein FZC74_00795 [Sutcliffiella horikoshii]